MEEETFLTRDRAQPHVPSRDPFDWLGRPVATRILGGVRAPLFFYGSIILWFLSFFGIYYNMVLFINKVLQEGSAFAASTTTNWLGSMFLFSAVGAILADSGLGCLWTAVGFQVINLVGLILISYWASILASGELLHGAVNSFYISLYVCALGNGAFQPSFSALGADQLNTAEEKRTFFSQYFISETIGKAGAATMITYVISAKGWKCGFWLCTGFGIVAFVLFLSGLPLYRQFKGIGNPFCGLLQVAVATIRNWNVQVPEDSNLLNELLPTEPSINRSKMHRTEGLRFLDKAATVSNTNLIHERSRDPWKVCTVTQVEEAKCICQLLPIWVSTAFFNTVFVQAGTFFVEQGATMNTKLGSLTMEPATMNMFTIVATVLCPAFYNWVIDPLARRFSGKRRGLTALQRIGLGYAVFLLGISIAAVTETERLTIVIKEGAKEKAVSMTVFWLVPQFIMLGAGLFLAGVGQLEVFYSGAPSSLRSFGTSFRFTCFALGSYISSVIVDIVARVTSMNGSKGWIPKNLNEGHLDYYYWLLAALTGLNIAFFTWCAVSFQTPPESKVGADES